VRFGRGLLVLAVPIIAWIASFHPEWIAPIAKRVRPDWVTEAGALDWAKLFPIVAAVVPAWLLLLLWRLPKWQVEGAAKVGGFDAKARADLEDTFRKTFAQVVAGIGAAGALYFTFQTSEAARQSSEAAREASHAASETQITEEYAKAIDQLGTTGDNKLAVRLGGIYALERIAKVSPRDRTAIMEVLTAFVRANVPRPPQPVASEKPSAINAQPAVPECQPRRQSLASQHPDIQAIMTVIGRRAPDYEQKPLDLGSANLSGADLRGATLSGANLDGVDLRGADLTHANLIDASLHEGADLSGAALIGADLSYADLGDANLSCALLNGAELHAVVLTAANLAGAELYGAKLQSSYLGLATLTGADLSDANLSDSDLGRANLSRARLVAANLSGADLNDATLSDATLSRAQGGGSVGLSRADLRGADLNDAHLSGANLYSANLGDAKLSGADLSGADLSHAFGVTQEQINAACVDEKTSLPPDITRPPACPIER
jgi:uncharacterized protein YjbI with pentapeptide repeats